MADVFTELIDRVTRLERERIKLERLPLVALRAAIIENGAPLDLNLLGLDTLATVPALVTSLPTGKDLKDGMEILYLADAANGIIWRLRYRAASSSSYKWECVGGSPLFAEVSAPAGNTSTASTSYVGLAGPSITVPLAGDYLITIGFEGQQSVAGEACFMSYNIGAVAAGDADRASVGCPQTTRSYTTVSMPHLKTVTAGTVFNAVYRVGTGTGTFTNRRMTATPIRVA